MTPENRQLFVGPSGDWEATARMAVAGMGGGHGGECGVRGPGIARRSNLHASKITSCMRRIICQSRNLAGPSLAAALALTWAAANWPPANLCRTVTGGARRGVQEAAEKSTPERFSPERYFAI